MREEKIGDSHVLEKKSHIPCGTFFSRKGYAILDSCNSRDRGNQSLKSAFLMVFE